MTLHQLNQSAYSASIVRDLCYCLQREDKVILIEDATIRFQHDSDDLLISFTKMGLKVYALESDILAYGITAPNNINVISDIEWVDLTNECNKHIAW
ncbi:sulfurtransferase complex subunit TusB [Marinomonas sp. 15G1-11]|uniref:Sulfurtransferase complex subunit TusB n=1 Tax=Marinomonas phaeophyticola TaxID=3004091 RepID=A0ABT4JYC5_9GAMM|nr:sulfurtransferase complex subunit TusB [Marinomonas sp. 15G1-11]MCZ2723225.1 sulfurtransferase complex subunit TusB [Marinomonas sp. 15G1-11]